MKKTIVVLVVACTMLANFSVSFNVLPAVQAQVSNPIITIGSTIASTIVKTIIESIGDGGEKFKAPHPTGVQDCHDEVSACYKYVRKADGTVEAKYVGDLVIKYGSLVSKPREYDFSKRSHYNLNNHYSMIDCIGVVTKTPCTPRFLSCEEQNP